MANIWMMMMNGLVEIGANTASRPVEGDITVDIQLMAEAARIIKRTVRKRVHPPFT